MGTEEGVSGVIVLEDLFPALRGSPYQVTSPVTDVYNCIAWAAGVTNKWWWPFGDPAKTDWPANAPRNETIDAFRQAFATLGHDECPSADLELGMEKIALFADAAGIPTHAARQLPTGRWTSKLGVLVDIEHELTDLEGTEYGSVALVMRRPVGVRQLHVTMEPVS
jgi:hypothetical protein